MSRSSLVRARRCGAYQARCARGNKKARISEDGRLPWLMRYCLRSWGASDCTRIFLYFHPHVVCPCWSGLSIGWVNLRCLHTQRCWRCACPCTCSCRHGLPPNRTFRANSACRHMLIRGVLHKRNFYIYVEGNSTTKLVCRARDTKGWDAQVREQEKSAK